jgi:WD40 repeat protein
MRTTGFFLLALAWIAQPLGVNAAPGQGNPIDHPGARAVAGTPDGKLWISSYRDIRIWDAATGRLVRTIVPDEVPERVTLMALRVTGDSKTVWAMTPTTIEGYAIASGKLIFRKKADQPPFCSFDVSRDGKTVVVGSNQNELIFWDTATEKVVRKIKGDRTRFTAMVAAGQALPGLDQPVGTVALSPDGRWVAAVALFDWTVCVYEVRTGQLKYVFPTNNPSYCAHLAFSPDSALLAASRFSGPGEHQGQEVISVWELPSGKPHQQFVEGAFCGFAVSPDWKWMAAAGTGLLQGQWTGEIHVWERTTGKRRCTIAGDKRNVYPALVFSRDGKTLVGCNHAAIEMWDADTGKPIPFGGRKR